MNKTLKIIGFVIAGCLIMFTCNKLISEQQTDEVGKYPNRVRNPVYEIRNTVSMINGDMPIKVNEKTTAMRVEYLEQENRFVLYYQVTGIKKGDLSKEEVDSTVQTLKRTKLEHTVNNPDNRTFIEQKVTFEYVYKDLNNDILYSFQITPHEYLSR